MNHGAGWIVFEESVNAGVRRLVSILPARRTEKDVAIFMRQLYADSKLAIEDRLHYKKHPHDGPYQVSRGPHHNPMHVGHNPWLMGIYADKIELSGNSLTFTYKILVNPDELPLQKPRFENRQQTLPVDV